MPPRKLKDKPKRFVRNPNPPRLSVKASREDKDSPVQLLEELVKKRLDPRDLSKEQRKAILVLQASGTLTPAELAALLEVRVKTIRRDLAEIRREIGREVTEWTLEDVVGGMVFAAEKYQARAMAQDDTALAWAIERDKVKLLKELGVIGASGDREGIRLTLEVLGRGYERATKTLSKAMDPVLTGMVVDVEHEAHEVLVPGPLELRRGLPLPQVPRSIPKQVDIPVVVVDPALEAALDQDVIDALEGEVEIVRGVGGEELEKLRRGGGI